MVRERTRVGLAAARDRGVKVGRPAKLNAHQQQEIIRSVRDGSKTAADAAQLSQKSSDFARMRRVLRIGLFISFCWVLSGNTAGAQQSTGATSKPGPTNPVPTPIPLPEIASQAQSTIKSLRDIEASLSTDQTTTTVEKRLPHLTEEIDLRTTENAKLLICQLSESPGKRCS
jgi:hypothetical protein